MGLWFVNHQKHRLQASSYTFGTCWRQAEHLGASLLAMGLWFINH
jgi:hypothetical protein